MRSDTHASPRWRISSDRDARTGLQLSTSTAIESLCYRGLWIRHEQVTPLPKDAIRVAEGARRVDIRLPQGCTEMLWPIDFGLSGYWDRMTGCTTGADRPDAPALTRFIAGGTGHTIMLESLKRIKPEVVAEGGGYTLHPRPTGSRSVLIDTRQGHRIRLEHGDGGWVRLLPDGDRVQVSVQAPSGLITLTVVTPGPVILDDGACLPVFRFGADTRITRRDGASATLNGTLLEFCQQAAFWYPSATGISAWGEWGPMGHSHVEGEYGRETMGALLGQMVADDGHGRDGYAWSWGNQRGWPFPNPKVWDTRHLNTNALHICGFNHRLQWSGAYDAYRSRALCHQILAGSTVVLDQPDRSVHMPMHFGHEVAQSFQSPAAFDAVDLPIALSSVNITLDATGMEEYSLYPTPEPSWNPVMIRSVDGQSLAQVVRPGRPYNTIGIGTATYLRTGDGCRIRMFRWTGDLLSTLDKAPLAEHLFTNVPDNTTLYLKAPEPLAAHEAVLIVLDNPTAPADEEPWIAAWCAEIPKSSALGPLFRGTAEWPGQSLRVEYGLRPDPAVQITLRTAANSVVWSGSQACQPGDHRYRIRVPRCPAGRYRVSITPVGGPLAVFLSQRHTEYPGEAYLNGHPWNPLDRARRLMRYQLDYLNAEKAGSPICDERCGDTHHLGLAGRSVGNNYYDIMPFGYKDAFLGACYHRSLLAMAEMETRWGSRAEATRLRRLADISRRRFTEWYWRDRTKPDGASRFIGCIDSEGNEHDYGFTFINTAAIVSGLTTRRQAEHILRWLDRGVSVDPDGKRQQDLYRYRFSARCTTIANPDWWQVGWDGKLGPWNKQLQHGGAVLHDSFYDIMARLLTRAPEDAYKRLLAILARYLEPDRLTGGSPLCTGENVQGGTTGGAGSMGVMTSEFPETALLPVAILFGFVGADARADGLHLRPRLPAGQPWVEACHIVYHGVSFDIRAWRDRIRLTARRGARPQRFRAAGRLLSPPFTVTLPLVRGELVISPVSG